MSSNVLDTNTLTVFHPTALGLGGVDVFEEFVGPVMIAPLACAESYALAIASTGRTNGNARF
jgi:hypothetical protein